MAVVPTDLIERLSGGNANTDPLNSLGGIISATAVNLVTTTNNLFDNVQDAEAASGDIEYRCTYLLNNSGTDTLKAAKVYIASNTPSADTTVQIGLDPAGVGNGSTTGVATTVANENTAPAGVVFSNAATSAAALAIGDLGPGKAIAIWHKRVVNAAAAPFASDPYALRLTGTP